MKRMFFAGLLALGSLALSQQQASAWGKFTLGAGFHVSWELPAFDVGFHFRCVPPPCCHGGYAHAPALPPSGFDPGWYNYAQSYHAPAQGGGTGGGQEAAGGYNPYGQATHFYTGYQQGPSYWYH